MEEVELESTGGEDAEVTARLEVVGKATKTWTGQLVDLTGRNNLLYFRDLKVGTLPLDPSQRQLIHGALAGRPVLLSKLFKEEEAFEDALKRARSVRNKANAHFEERGIETLYLACGDGDLVSAEERIDPGGPGPPRSLSSRAERGRPRGVRAHCDR